MGGLALTELLGQPVVEASGEICGRVREVALTPADDRARVSNLIVRTKNGDRLLPFSAVVSLNGSVRAGSPASEWVELQPDGLFLLERDLLDQQIIDVYGRKVVRVNDVDLHPESAAGHVQLKVGSVDVGLRGAIRRLLKGVVPSGALKVVLERIPPRLIPWEFVDLIETDPARRVKLKISHDRLARLHPADIADIIEELTPSEREAVFETLDEEVAAGALEEVRPKVQKAILESLDSDRAAEIVEEMQPDAAADLLADLSQEKTESILEEMGAEEAEEVSGLLEFKHDSAAGRMTTELIALPVNASAHDAVEALRHYEGGVETVSTIFLVDSRQTLSGMVPLSKLVLAAPTTPLLSLTQEPLISCHENASDQEVTELFDKYNLLTLPVVDDQKKLTGVITSDDVISLL